MRRGTSDAYDLFSFADPAEEFAVRDAEEGKETPAVSTGIAFSVIASIWKGSASGFPLIWDDASSHIRGKPLADPFHMEAMTEKAMPVETAGVSLPSSASRTANSSAGSAKEKRSYASDVPRLMGVMSFGSEKRAVIEVHGVTYTVKEGEQAGLWNVSSIQGKTVTLAGASGVFTLSTR